MNEIYLYAGDCRQLAEIVPDCDAHFTDPPYSAFVHTNAVSCSAYTGGQGARKRELGFDPLTAKLSSFLAWTTTKVKGWSLFYSDVESAQDLRKNCELQGAKYIRTIPWVRWSMPQLAGDRPPQGQEKLLVFLHEEGLVNEDLDLVLFGSEGKKTWFGPGSLTHLDHKRCTQPGKHKAQKSLDQCMDLVSWFTRPGETIFDACAGRATFGLSCRLLGRNYLGAESDPAEHQRGVERLESPLNAYDLREATRWLDATKTRIQTVETSAHKRSKGEERYLQAAPLDVTTVIRWMTDNK